MSRSSGIAGAVVVGALLGLGGLLPVQGQVEEPRLSVTWRAAPIHEVLMALADVSGRSIVVGGDVSGFVTATIEDQPWDATLEAIVTSHGLVAVESESGILRVERLQTPGEREAADPVVTRAYRIRFVPADEMLRTLAPLLSGRGTISVAPSTNTVVVSDVPRVQATIAGLLR